MADVKMGVHILLNLTDCPLELLQEKEPIEKMLREVVEEGELTLLHSAFHQFEPHGATGILLLAESHLSVHTWPEYKSAAVDVFFCRDAEKAEKTADIIIKKFSPCGVKRRTIIR